jgi:hypothetical protein
VETDTSFINPMHPLDTIPGLREGTHGRIRVVDPLADAARGFAAKLFPWVKMVGARMTIEDLDADVSHATLHWGGKDVSCLVIDYRKPGKKLLLARTWVRIGDNRVLRQEAAFKGSRLVMERGQIN